MAVVVVAMSSAERFDRSIGMMMSGDVVVKIDGR
jgi:hypothetical protein